jgi:hypothetical protein
VAAAATAPAALVLGPGDVVDEAARRSPQATERREKNEASEFFTLIHHALAQFLLRRLRVLGFAGQKTTERLSQRVDDVRLCESSANASANSTDDDDGTD